jgi:ubiquitin carboxyl-terminal hydrolase 25/28
LDEQVLKLSGEIERMTNRLTELENSVHCQFETMKNHGYRVHSVFIHRGQATFGHYWIYINDIKNRVFRKYNDEYITEVQYSEVFDTNDENTATPYFVVFVREDLANDYVDALVRDPTSK